MSRLDGIPLVQREGDVSKSCKMIFVTGVIIVALLCVMFYKKHDTVYICGNSDYVEPMSDIRPNDQISPIFGKFIQLINLNKSMIPVDKIVIIDVNRNMIPLFTKNAKHIKIGQNGSMWQYELDKPVYISQVIIDLNMFDKRKENIVNTQLKIRDVAYEIIWSSYTTLSVKKYIDVYIAQQDHIYPALQHILNPDLSTYGQEVTLGYHLMRNTW